MSEAKEPDTVTRLRHMMEVVKSVGLHHGYTNARPGWTSEVRRDIVTELGWAADQIDRLQAAYITMSAECERLRALIKEPPTVTPSLTITLPKQTVSGEFATCGEMGKSHGAMALRQLMTSLRSIYNVEIDLKSTQDKRDIRGIFMPQPGGRTDYQRDDIRKLLGELSPAKHTFCFLLLPTAPDGTFHDGIGIPSSTEDLYIEVIGYAISTKELAPIPPRTIHAVAKALMS